MGRSESADLVLDNLVAGTVGLAATGLLLFAPGWAFGLPLGDFTPGWYRALASAVAGDPRQLSDVVAWVLLLASGLAVPIVLLERRREPDARRRLRAGYWRVAAALLGSMLGSAAGSIVPWGLVGCVAGWLAGSAGAWLSLGKRPVPKLLGRSVLGAFVAAAVLSALVPGRSALPGPQRIVIVCVDTLRADHVSSYGYARQTTPNLDRVAREEGVLFENVYASSSWTLPSVTTLFTSLEPPEHAVEDRGRRLERTIPTLAGTFLGAGWLTSAQVTHIYVSSLFGLDSGFLEFREHSIDWSFKEGRQLRADALNAFVLPWIAHHARDRFLLYLHYFDPHWDYDPPPPFDSRYADPRYSGPATGSWLYLREFLPRDVPMPPTDLAQVVALYDGEVAWTDVHLSRLFDALKAWGLWEDTLLVVTSDHGEEFQEHGSVHHIRTLYEEVLRVPLIVKLPGGRPRGVRARISERVRLLDIAPTVTEISGVSTPPTFRGESLVPLLWQEGPDRPVLAHTVRHGSDTLALITGREKLIHVYAEGRESLELYDLGRDPGENASRAAELPKRVEALRREAVARYELAARAAPQPGQAVTLTEQQEEHLRSLGYVE